MLPCLFIVKILHAEPTQIRKKLHVLRIDSIPQQVADDIQGLRLDLSLKARYNKFIDNQEFVEI